MRTRPLHHPRRPGRRGSTRSRAAPRHHGGMATKTGTLEKPRGKTDTRLAKPWQVIVHNDPVNLMVYVTRVFMQVLGFARPKAEKHMLEVHHQGRSVVWTGGREQAEVYTLKLRAAHLLTTMEPVEG